MKKIYEKPEINIVALNSENIITESGPNLQTGVGGLVTSNFSKGENIVTY